MLIIRTLILIALLTFSSCYRGESKSIDSLLDDAKARFTSVGIEIAVGAAQEDLKSLVADLEALASDKSSSEAIERIIENLDRLTPRANYSVRPAMTELLKQYSYLMAPEKEQTYSKAELMSIVVDPGVASSRSQSARKLLVARTYLLLANELEVGKFGLGS